MKETLNPIKENFNNISDEEISKIMKEHSKKANEIAEKNGLNIMRISGKTNLLTFIKKDFRNLNTCEHLIIDLKAVEDTTSLDEISSAGDFRENDLMKFHFGIRKKRDYTRNIYYRGIMAGVILGIIVSLLCCLIII